MTVAYLLQPLARVGELPHGLHDALRVPCVGSHVARHAREAAYLLMGGLRRPSESSLWNKPQGMGDHQASMLARVGARRHDRRTHPPQRVRQPAPRPPIHSRLLRCLRWEGATACHCWYYGNNQGGTGGTFWL